mgnify:CR=1 FL=1
MLLKAPVHGTLGRIVGRRRFHPRKLSRLIKPLVLYLFYRDDHRRDELRHGIVALDLALVLLVVGLLGLKVGHGVPHSGARTYSVVGNL